MRRDKVHLLAACFVLAAVSTLAGQETPQAKPQETPAPSSIAALEELPDLRAGSRRQAYIPVHVEKMTQDYVQFYLPGTGHYGLTESDPHKIMVTVRKGQTLPDSNFVATGFTETMIKSNGLNRLHREIHVRSSRSGWSYTYSPDLWPYLDAEPDAAAFFYHFTLHRPGIPAISIEPGEEFIHPANSTTKYRVKAIYSRIIVIERVTDGHTFKVAVRNLYDR